MTVPEKISALPCWTGPLRAEPLHGGYSNESWKVTDAAGAHVVRFGPDYPFHHVERAREVMTARAAHAAGFAPAVEYAGPGVMVVAFLEARTWGAEDVRNNPAWVGSFLRRFHTEMQDHVSGPGYLFWPFHVIRDYARTLTDRQSRHVPHLPRLLALARVLEAAQVPQPIVFGHHDLLPANFLDQDGEQLWLIDFEYAGFGTAMFDLAGLAGNAEMEADGEEALLARYFGRPPDQPLLRSFAAMKCTALMREAMWAMVSEIYLSAPGSDYGAHAREYLGRLERALDLYQASYGKITL